MKKLAMSVIALLMAVAMMVTASAGNFVNSVGQVGKPELQGNREVTRGVYLLLTPYSDRRTLPDKGADLEAAYKSIQKATSVSELCKDLTALAKSMGVDPMSLIVSDLFDLSLVDINSNFLPEQGLTVNVSMKADLLNQFVGLIHYENGKWTLVPGATVKDGEILNFKTDELATFAIVINKDGPTNPTQPSGGTSTTAKKDSPDTGDAQPWIYAAALAVLGLGVFAVTCRRKNAAE